MIKCIPLKSIFIIIILVSCFQSKAQKSEQPVIDSLQYALRNFKSSCIEPCKKDTVKVSLLNNLAWALRSSKIDTAIVLCNDALLLSEKIGWEFGVANSCFRLGWLSFLKDDFDKAISYYNASLNTWNRILIKEPQNTQIIIRKSTTIGAFGSLYSKRGDYVRALEKYSESIKIDSAINNTNGILANLGNLGISYTHLGRYDDAINNFFTVLKYAEEKKDYRRMAIQYLSIGNAYNQLEQFDKSIYYLNEAIRISDINGNAINKINALTAIGTTYNRLENPEKALEYFMQSYNLETKTKGIVGTSTLIGLGSAYFRQKNYASSYDYYEKALNRSRELNDSNLIAMGYLNIGNVYAVWDKNKEAEEYYLKAIDGLAHVGDIHTLVLAYSSLSDLYEKQGRTLEALESYKNSVIIKDSIFTIDKSKEITRKEMKYEFEKKEVLAKAESDKQIALADKRREIAEAEKKIAFAETDKRLSLSEAEKRIALANADRERLIAIAEKEKSEIESEKQVKQSIREKERQKLISISITGFAGIVLLSGLIIFLFYKRKRDAEQKEKQAFHNLQVSETEMKALRSQMNPHFIFNALQSIQTFLLRHQPEEANLYLLKFAKLMRAVLENSLESEVPLKNDLQALELYMQLESIRLPHPFSYNIQIEDDIDPEQALIPPLILQPFVENAIWHGLQHKKEPGHINIFIKRNGTTLVATVEDDGVGRDMSKKVEKPMLMKKESLGIKITEERLRILNDQKKISSGFEISDLFSNAREPIGTRIDLRIPEAM